MFEQAARAVSRSYRLDHHDVVARARAFEAPPAGQRGGAMSLDDVEDRSGVPAPHLEVARRTFWTALGDACERERLPRGFADEAIASPEKDHAMLARVRRAEFSDLAAVVSGLRPRAEAAGRRQVGAGAARPRGGGACGGGRGRGSDTGVDRRRRAAHGVRGVADPSRPGGPGPTGGGPRASRCGARSRRGGPPRRGRQRRPKGRRCGRRACRRHRRLHPGSYARPAVGIVFGTSSIRGPRIRGRTFRPSVRGGPARRIPAGIAMGGPDRAAVVEPRW